MFLSVQVTACLGRPIARWSILQVNDDEASLFEAIQAGRFDMIPVSKDLKNAKLSQTFVGSKTDTLMVVSSSQSVSVCSQFGNYVRFSVDIPSQQSVPVTLPNAFAIMTASQRRLQMGDNGLHFSKQVVRDSRDRLYNDFTGTA